MAEDEQGSRIRMSCAGGFQQSVLSIHLAITSSILCISLLFVLFHDHLQRSFCAHTQAPFALLTTNVSQTDAAQSSIPEGADVNRPLSVMPTKPKATGQTRILWFMAASSYVPPQYEHYGKVALMSAMASAPSLVPVLLYPGANSTAYVDWFEAQGGLVIRCRTSLLARWEAGMASGQLLPDQLDAEANWLRFEIPAVIPNTTKALKARGMDMSDVSTTHALYTDMDVMFVRDFNASELGPVDIVALGAEGLKDTGEPANAGVLYMNLEACKVDFPAMLQFGEQDVTKYLGHTNQGVFLSYFKGRAKFLPDQYNYKAYWGYSEAIVLIHFHGPKPENGLPCYVRNGPNVEACTGKQSYWQHYHYCWNMALEADGGRYVVEAMSRYRCLKEAALLSSSQRMLAVCDALGRVS